MRTRSSPSDSDDCARIPGSDREIKEWIADARAGCATSLGQLVQRCRHYLLLVANQELKAELRGKVGASDLVQEALVTTQQVFDRFTGTSEEELRQWTRRILLNKISKAWRHYGQTAKRDVYREQPFDLAEGLGEWPDLADRADTPRTIALAKEQALQIERIVERLPERYRQAIRLRCFERLSFVAIGAQLDISPAAARKRWCRAIEFFRQEWEARDGSG